MTETPQKSLRLRDSLLRETNQELAKESSVARPAPKLSSSAQNAREFLEAVPFYNGPEPLRGLPTRLLLERIFGEKGS